VNQFNDETGQVYIMVYQPKVKTTMAYKFPTLLKRNTIKLERDAFKLGLFYITFEYDSFLDFTAYFHFNAIRNTNPINPQNFVSSQDFIGPLNSDGIPCLKGHNMKFNDTNACFDFNQFLSNKQEVSGSTDLVIELVVMKENRNGVECVLATFCKLIEERVDTRVNCKIKVESQKLNVKGTWFELHDVYGLSSESNSNECEICCTNKRNTIFLPCKHSYACNNCAHSLRMRNNPCPICRNAINDLHIKENEEKPNNTGSNESRSNEQSGNNLIREEERVKLGSENS